MKFEPLAALILLAFWVHLCAPTTPDGDHRPAVKSVLMVCVSNFALSPMAQAIFHDLAQKKNVSGEWRCDSAGITARSSDQINEKAAAKLREYKIEPQNRTCMQLEENDFNNYDYALTMDREQLRDIRGMALVGSRAKMELLASYDPLGSRLIRTPDFWATVEAYEEPFHIINRSCNAFLDRHSTSVPAKASPESSSRRKK